MGSIAPKRRISSTRRDKKRSSLWKLDPLGFSKCTQCGELKLPHVVCKSCGYYKGKEVIKMEA